MTFALKILARLGLLLTLLPPVLFLTGTITLSQVKTTMLIGTALWLVCAPIVQRQRDNLSKNLEVGNQV